jgi:hypothetical protein
MMKRGELQEERGDIFGALQAPICFEYMLVVCTWEAISQVERDQHRLPPVDTGVVSDGSASYPADHRWR